MSKRFSAVRLFYFKRFVWQNGREANAMKFLIIDNHRDDRERIKQVLQKEFPGLEFSEAASREDFDDAIIRGGFDVVLTDYLLGWTDGLWILKTVKERFPDMPVIMVTGMGNEEIAVAGMKYGLSDYVLKKHLRRLPVAAEECLNKIRSYRKDDGVTGQAKASEELKIFKILFSEIRDLAYICDTNGNILYVNKIFEKFTGHKPEEFFGKPFSPLFDEENLKKAMEFHTKTVKGESLQFELCFKDTGIICEYKNFHLKDERGNIVNTIGIARDITERKRMEKTLWETNQTLQALIQASPLAIIALDPQGNVTMWNPAAERMFGWNKQEVLGNPLPIVPEDKQEEFRALRERVLRGESFTGVEVRRQKRNGSPIDISLSTAPLEDGQGNVSGIMGVVADITLRKRTEAIDVLLHEIDLLVLQGQTLDFVLPHVCERLVDLLAFPLIWIGMKELDGSVSISAKAGTHMNYLNGLDVRWDDDTTAIQCLIAFAIRSGQTQTSSAQEPGFQQCREYAYKHGFESFAFVPLRAQGKVLGTLNLYATKPDAFDTETIRVLENLAARISVTLLIAIDQQQLRLQSIAMASVANAVFITNCEGHIKWVNNAFTSLSGYRAEEVTGKTPRLFKSGKHDISFYRQVWQTILAGKVWRGEIVNRHKDGSLYTVNQTITPLLDTRGKVCHFVAIHEDISEKKEAEERILYMAHYDALTNLPNRVLFRDHLELELAHAHRNGRMVAVMFLDLDRFKIINDTLGHVFGDQLLKVVAERLRACVREGDTVSRLGGDEFTFIIPDIVQPQDAVLIAQKILNVMSRSFQVEGREVHVTPSIGIAMYPSDATDADSLIKKADTAMYHAKEQGKNSFKFYRDDMDIDNFERLTLENGLRKALEKRELLVYYQPLIDQNTGQIISMEALTRWQHPELGMICPAKFIPVAEETGLIIPIGEWVLLTACAQTRAWHDAGFHTLRVTVNLSARQFKQQNLISMITQALQETGLDPHYLELELTEGIVMQNDAAILSALRELKSMGIHLSIDDFGTQYSSLGYLKRFPIDTLKIDRSFVHDITTNPDDAAIVTAIIAIAESLKLKVVAEGVENKEQAAFLHKLRCNNIQGYVYSHPLPPGDIEHLLQKIYKTAYQKQANEAISFIFSSISFILHQYFSF
ncbi:MAG: EAL domain-containing protein [Candidatus Brocadia sp.]|jgi:diguanylate cyclase (GGDEF)-like protein/PAS domain S-box-containing protein